MSNRRAQCYKKKIKKKGSHSKARKKIAAQFEEKSIDDCQKVVFVSLEEILDRISALERKGDITHAQALEVAERYINAKPNEIIVPKNAYDLWSV